MSDLKQTHNFWHYSFVRVGLEWSLNQDGGGWLVSFDLEFDQRKNYVCPWLGRECYARGKYLVLHKKFICKNLTVLQYKIYKTEKAVIANRQSIYIKKTKKGQRLEKYMSFFNR